MLEPFVEPRAASAGLDLVSLADLVCTVFEGAFILVRTLDDPELMRRQLAHLRSYVELLFDLEPAPR